MQHGRVALKSPMCENEVFQDDQAMTHAAHRAMSTNMMDKSKWEGRGQRSRSVASNEPFLPEYPKDMLEMGLR